MFTPRHERAIVIGTTYVIGFTAAFLLYAEPKVSVDLFPQNNAATVITAVPEVLPVVPPAAIVTPTPTVSVEYYDGRLAVKSGDKQLYSSTDFNLLTPEEMDAGANYFAGAPIFKIAPDAASVFLCEFQAPDATSCKGQIITSEGEIERITVSGNPVAIKKESADTAIFTAFGFKVSSFESIDPSTPWALQ